MAEKQEKIIDQILALTDVAAIIKELTKDDEYLKDAETNQKQYDGDHKILLRPDKKVGKDDKVKDVPVARLVATFQKVITSLAVAFLVGKPVKYVLDSEENTEEAFKQIEGVFDANKIQYFDRKLTRTTMIETRTAELWYAKNETFDEESPVPDTDPEYIGSQIGVMLLSNKLGYHIYPHFDQYGNMDAFTVTYDMEQFDTEKNAIATVSRVDVYTAENFVFYFKEGDAFKLLETKPNQYGKIPVIYYEQEQAEWKDVQSLIERYEDLISNHADENDYYAAPMIKIMGKLIEPPDKTQTGKMLQFAGVPSPDQKKLEYGDASYLTWDHEPVSLKLELDNLKDLIFSNTHTPDISFNSVKGLTSISGILLKMLFFDARLKSFNHQEVFGEGFTRRLNLVKKMLQFTSVASEESLQAVVATPQFQDPTPQDIAETITTLSEALAGEPIMSEDTALKNNPYVTDIAEEKLEMEKDKQSKETTEGFEAGSFDAE